MLVSEKLLKLFPTPESILEIKKNYSSWKAMCNAVGISENSLYDHRRALGMEVSEGNAKKKGRFFADYLTMPQIDENIRELVKGESKNVVTTYRIADWEKFNQNPCGYDGLALIGTEHGSTWQQIGHRMPNAIGGSGYDPS